MNFLSFFCASSLTSSMSLTDFSKRPFSIAVSADLEMSIFINMDELRPRKKAWTSRFFFLSTPRFYSVHMVTLVNLVPFGSL